jgi:predicted enzyme related to lactoylglutathione lyase
MAAPRLARLILWVKDPDRLSQWYCQAFSWTEKFRDYEAGWIEIDADGFILALHGRSELKPRRWPKMQVVVQSVSEYKERLANLGIKMSEIQKWKHLEWSECSDPEGNTVQICNQ